MKSTLPSSHEKTKICISKILGNAFIGTSEKDSGSLFMRKMGRRNCNCEVAAVESLAALGDLKLKSKLPGEHGSLSEYGLVGGGITVPFTYTLYCSYVPL